MAPRVERWQGCWFCQGGGADACSRDSVPDAWKKDAEVVFACVYCHNGTGRSLAYHWRMKLSHAVGRHGSRQGLSTPGALALTLPSNWGPAHSNRKLSCPGSCWRAKLQSFSTDSRPSELDHFECGAEPMLAQGQRDGGNLGVQQRQNSWFLGSRTSSSIYDKTAAGGENGGVGKCGDLGRKER